MRKRSTVGEIICHHHIEPLLNWCSEVSIYDIITGMAPVTDDIAKELAIVFDTSKELWMNLYRNALED